MSNDLIRVEGNNSLNKLLNDGQNVRIGIITGGAGVGKSSVIMRMAHMKADQGFRVFYISENTVVYHRQIVNFQLNGKQNLETAVMELLRLNVPEEERDNCYVFIDEADMMLGWEKRYEESKSLVESLRSSGARTVISVQSHRQVSDGYPMTVSEVGMGCAHCADLVVALDDYERKDNSCNGRTLKDRAGKPTDFKLFMKTHKRVVTSFEF